MKKVMVKKIFVRKKIKNGRRRKKQKKTKISWLKNAFVVDTFAINSLDKPLICDSIKID